MDKKLRSLEWCAGFFEGEGNAYIRQHNKADRIYPCLSLQVAQVGREPLDAFQECFGVGKVRGPYGPYSSNRQPYYQYSVSGSDAVSVAEQLIPLMFQKGVQVQAALNEYMEYVNDRKNAA